MVKKAVSQFISDEGGYISKEGDHTAQHRKVTETAPGSGSGTSFCGRHSGRRRLEAGLLSSDTHTSVRKMEHSTLREALLNSCRRRGGPLDLEGQGQNAGGCKEHRMLVLLF